MQIGVEHTTTSRDRDGRCICGKLIKSNNIMTDDSRSSERILRILPTHILDEDENVSITGILPKSASPQCKGSRHMYYWQYDGGLYERACCSTGDWSAATKELRLLPRTWGYRHILQSSFGAIAGPLSDAPAHACPHRHTQQRTGEAQTCRAMRKNVLFVMPESAWPRSTAQLPPHLRPGPFDPEAVIAWPCASAERHQSKRSSRSTGSVILRRPHSQPPPVEASVRAR